MTAETPGPLWELEERLRFETLIADLSSVFVNLSPGDVDREIEDAQGRVCQCLGLDLSALFQWSAETPRVLMLTHAYGPHGGPPTPDGMDASEFFPWCQQRIEAGQVVAVSSTDELPAEAARDRQTWLFYGIQASLTLPLSAGGGPSIGALSFNTTRAERAWPETVVKRLQLIAQIFTNALARKRSDEMLRQSEERLELAADSAGAGLWSLNLATDRFWVTRKACELFGLSLDEEVTLERILGLIHPEDRDKTYQIMDAAVDSVGEALVEYRILRPDGRVRWLHSRGRVRCNASGEPECLMGVSVDITEHKQAEEAVRVLAGKLLTAQEAERRRLAREMHDDLTQRIAVLAIESGKLEQEFEGSAPLAGKLRDIRDQLIRLSQDVHGLSRQLHPSILDDLGLVDALRSECASFSQRERIEVHFASQDIPPVIPKEVALCLYRIAQEGLRNIAKHSRAPEASVSLTAADDSIMLSIEDTGVGFTPGQPQDKPGLGLASMEERARLIGGELSIRSEPGKGTLVEVWAPCSGNTP